MTGFGAGHATSGTEEISVEVRSVNHKFCEVKARLPRELASLEPGVLKTVKGRVARGAVDVTLKRQGRAAEGNVPSVDLALAREYQRAFSEVARGLGLPDNVTSREIGSLSGVIRLEEPGIQLEEATAAAHRGLELALGELVRMREVEGEAMRIDLETRIALVQRWATEVAELAPRAVEDHHARLTERVAELARGVPVDAQRLAQEVAFFAERTDIAEEVTRLASHLEQFRQLMVAPEPAGRKMDFLVQEMHREVNTTGSKSQHAEISRRIVAMKAELERIREQVQNVE